MKIGRALAHALGVVGAIGALCLSGWAANSGGPGSRAHPFTLAPIMATTRTGRALPQRPLAPTLVATAQPPR